MATKAQPQTIDEYIQPFPSEVRKRLETLRQIIRKAAPNAQETIKYTIPTFTLNGNMLSIAAYKNHIGMYPTPAVTGDLKKKLAPYVAAKSTLRFPLDEPLPLPLIRKVVKLRVQQFTQRKKPQA